MWSSFRLVPSTDLPLFQLLTVFSRFPIRAAFQPLHQLIFHHQFAPAYPQGWKIRAAQKVICAHFGNLQRFGKLLCIHHIGHGFQWFSAHKSPSQHKKAATKNRDCLKCLVLSCVLVQEIAVLPGNEIFISPSQLLNALADCAG